MPDLADAIDQFRAHDPARGLPPLSSSAREINRDQIVSAARPDTRGSGSRRHGPRRFLTPRWAVLGASVAVAVAALVGIENVSSDGPGRAGLSFTVPPAAAAQLQRVAHAASVQVMPAAGQWEYLGIKLENRGTISGANTTLAYTETQTLQTWYATDGEARQRITNDSFAFATPQDRAMYLADRAAFAHQLTYDPMVIGAFEDRLFPSKGVSQPLWVSSPPTDPRTLITEIWDQYVSVNGGSHQPGLRAERPEILWISLTGLLLSSTSARLRATAYRALAYVPYTSVIGARIDQLGRFGIAISFTHDSTGTIQTLIVSPATGDLLELDRTQKRSSNGLAAGTVTQREIFLQRAIVAAAVSLPGGGYQPLDSSSRG